MSSGADKVTGAAPMHAAGQDERARAAAVRQMFTAIAPRYDFLNHLLSLNVDKIWWRRTARAFADILGRPNARVLDMCCGTGDLCFALSRQATQKGSMPTITGVDFSHAMLVRAVAKYHKRQLAADTALCWIEADALRLPFPDNRFHLATSAFGFRNLANYDAGLREIYRVLTPGGELGILDFGEPKGHMARLYRLYFRHVLPAVGTLVSGVRGPYAYLPASVRCFPSPQEMLTRLRCAGFRDVSWTPYTFGIAGLYRGTK